MPDEYIKTEVVSLRDVIGNNNCSYVIPGFQRPYEWKQENLENTFTSVFEAYSNREKNSKPCIFGTLQFNRNNDKMEIIDGQQRITTLYLLLKTVKYKDVCFAPQNDINKEYEYELKELKGKYGENAGVLNNLVLKNLKLGEYECFAEYLLNNVKFIQVTTAESSLDDVVKIFDTLNTTGLDLDTKDLFKIKYCHAIVNDEKTEKKLDQGQVFEKINSIYSAVLDTDSLGRVYAVTEDDLLYAFKFWIIGNEDSPSVSDVKKSNIAFFDDLFKKALPEAAKYDSFKKLGRIIVDIQTRISQWDKNLATKDCKDRILRLCARELLAWSGYGVFKNLLYVYAYALMQKTDPDSFEKATISDECINRALELTELTWKLCSLFHAQVGQVINDVYNSVLKNILVKVIKSNDDYDKIYNSILKWASEYVGYKNIDENNELQHWRMKGFDLDTCLDKAFENSRKHLFVALSYIDDYIGNDIKQLKQDVFYRLKWDIDIEHVISQDLWSDSETSMHSIGNLIYLEKDINRSFGKNTSKSKNITEDMKRKLGIIKQSEKDRSYRTSCLSSVIRFCECYINNFVNLEEANDETFINIIRSRNKNKKHEIRNIYASLLPESGVENDT